MLRPHCPPELDYALKDTVEQIVKNGKLHTLNLNVKLNIYDKIKEMHSQSNEMIDDEEARRCW
jgi:hypothetical protein